MAQTPFDRTDSDRMLAIAECRRVGPSFGWNEDYLADLGETDQIAQRIKFLASCLNPGETEKRIKFLRRLKKRALEYLQDNPDAADRERLEKGIALTQAEIDWRLAKPEAVKQEIGVLEKAYLDACAQARENF